MSKMSYSVTEVSLEHLSSLYTDSKLNLNWSSVFITPVWLEAWWQVFGEGRQPFIRLIRDADRVIGIAPLILDEQTARFIGGTDVCDYQDFIIEPGAETEFFTVLLDDLVARRINHLDLKDIRHDSTVSTRLVNLARERGYRVTCNATEVSVEMDLPPTWEEYLSSLNTKQRHEVRRKLRRLTEEGKVDYHLVTDAAAVPGFMDVFLKMFTGSRADKAEFLTTKRKAFFRALIEQMSPAGFLKLGILELDSRAMATIICFDYNDTMYLYNSGYDPGYDYLSVGLLSKVLCIKDSIESGKKIFDFLKGAEPYKYHLGGKEMPLYSCQISLA